eukprot:UN23299
MDTTHTGEYFNFNNGDAENVFGNDWPTDKTQEVQQWRRNGNNWLEMRTVPEGFGPPNTVIVWRSDNRTPSTQGTGHGRWVSDPDQDQWEKGDEIFKHTSYGQPN